MWEFPEKFLGLFKDSLAILQAACGAAHLQVLLVVVEDHGEEDGHEDEGVDQDVDDEEDGEGRAGVVRRHPEHRGAAAWASAGWGGADSGQDGAPAGLLGAHMTSGLLAVVTST